MNPRTGRDDALSDARTGRTPAHGPPAHEPPASSFTTQAQAAFRRGGLKRLAGAVVAALAGLALLVLLGPDEKAVKERFEYYGAPGEMRIMPEISIDKGADPVHQLPKSLQQPPPPASIEVEPEKLSPRATEPTPPPQRHEPKRVYDVTRDPVPEAEYATTEQVELLLPQQTSRDFFIYQPMARPEYPLDATELDRRQPYVYVWLQVWVGPDGKVTDVIVESNDGSEAFAREAVAAVAQWQIGWRTDPGPGRWLRFPWRFKSPYFTPGIR